MIRRTVFFSGHVQGVGFRYTAHHVAGRFDVTGYVKNLADGRVEAVVEGECEEVAAFVNAVREEMSTYIHDVRCTDSQGTGEFTDFALRF